MSDCSKTEVFFKEYKRMCRSYHNIKECKIHRKVNNCGACMTFVNCDTEKAIKIVQEWSDQNPVRTRLTVFKEQYPNAVTSKNNDLPAICVGNLYGYGCSSGLLCEDCWNTPVEESENNG